MERARKQVNKREGGRGRGEVREGAEIRQRDTKKIDSRDNVYDSFVNRERTGVLRQNSVRTHKK